MSRAPIRRPARAPMVERGGRVTGSRGRARPGGKPVTPVLRAVAARSGAAPSRVSPDTHIEPCGVASGARAVALRVEAVPGSATHTTEYATAATIEVPIKPHTHSMPAIAPVQPSICRDFAQISGPNAVLRRLTLSDGARCVRRDGGDRHRRTCCACRAPGSRGPDLRPALSRQRRS